MAKKFFTVEGEGIDVEYAPLTAAQAKKILKEGISETELDDFASGSDTESGVCRASIILAGKVVRELSIDDFPRKKVMKLAARKGWFLVKEQTEAGTFRRIEFRGQFDPKKLLCSADFFDLNGFHFGYLDLSYENEEGEFGETYPQHGGDWFILNPDGERLSFEVFAEDDDEED